MELVRYFNIRDNTLYFSRSQGSDFAKGVAGDFNPIHNVDAKRFCVPGDLLFAVFIHHYGVYRNMFFEFSGMVDDRTELLLPVSFDHRCGLNDAQDKNYLTVQADGECNKDARFGRQLIKQYVQFSGRTFPHILVDLMRQNAVMINTARPLVIYKSMSLSLDGWYSGSPSLELTEATLDADGKKGEVRLMFSIEADGGVVGYGEKHMLLSGLRPYDQGNIDQIIGQYNTWKSDYHALGASQ